MEVFSYFFDDFNVQLLSVVEAGSDYPRDLKLAVQSAFDNFHQL